MKARPSPEPYGWCKPIYTMGSPDPRWKPNGNISIGWLDCLSLEEQIEVEELKELGFTLEEIINIYRLAE